MSYATDVTGMGFLVRTGRKSLRSAIKIKHLPRLVNNRSHDPIAKDNDLF